MNRLDEIRKERGITVIGLCRRLNISNRTYYKYRSGEWAIPSDCLCNMSRILDVSTDYILGIKNYTHITVTDNEGVVIADIGQRGIIEHDNYNVVLT